MRWTIHIPDPLGRRIEAAEGAGLITNRSAFFQEAAAEKLDKPFEAPDADDAALVAARIEISWRQARQDAIEHGYARGYLWAKNDASYENLLRLEQMDAKGFEVRGYVRESGIWGPLAFVCDLNNWPYHLASEMRALLFWEPHLKDSPAQLDNVFVANFASGALDLWRRVKPHLTARIKESHSKAGENPPEGGM